MYHLIVIDFFSLSFSPFSSPVTLESCHVHLNSLHHREDVEIKKFDPVDRETKHFQSFFDIYLIVLVRTHAWDNKVNVIHHRCASNLSRIFLISWTNDMLSTYNPFILSNRVNVSYIQMNASHEYGSHVARPNFDRFSIFFSSLQEFAQWLHCMM